MIARKDCGKCGSEKIKRKGKSVCLKCARASVRRAYFKNHEKSILKSRAYRKQNPDAGREAKFKYKYGITLSEYNILFENQNGLCAICTKPSTRKHLDVDHCHDTGIVRGLLCRKCNLGIGHFDSPTIIKSAIRYLKENSDENISNSL